MIAVVVLADAWTDGEVLTGYIGAKLGVGEVATTGFMPKPLLWRNRTSRVSRCQEFERLANELLVVLEDAAVSGVRVDFQRRIWEATRQVV